MSQAMPQQLAQPVLVTPAKAAIFLTLTVRQGCEQAAREALADVPGLRRSVGFRIPEAGLTCVVGIGSRFWDRAYTDLPRPAGLHPFIPLSGSVHTAVSTPGDLFFHIRATRQDFCFELARQLLIGLDGLVDVADEVHGFRYFDERDLLGFVDGTENPEPPLDDVTAALVADDAVYNGASYLIVQKYLHDMTAWEALPVEEQERVIGRTKLSDIELDDDVKPSNSHVALNTVTGPDGDEQQIVRDNLPFGHFGDAEFGTYFIGYAADVSVTEQMLTNMFIGDPPGNYDRILDFSTAVTGCLFFVPPAAFLEDPEDFAIADAQGQAVEAAVVGAADAAAAGITDTAPSSPADGSLGIGSLKGSHH